MRAGDPTAPPAWQDPILWRHSFEEGGVVKCRFGSQGHWLVAEWPDLARLTCNRAGTRMQLRAYRGAPRQTVAKLRGVVNVLVGDLRGGLGVHASAVALGGRAVLLLGQADAGKSTAAAELCLRHGAGLLADDVSLLQIQRGVIRVIPSEERHYLTPESGRALGVRITRTRIGPKGKAPVTPARVAKRGTPVAVAAFLRFDDSLPGIVCTPLRGAQGALRVLSSLYRFNLDDRRGELERVDHLFAQAQVIEIARPRRSPSVAKTVLETLGDRRG